MAIRSFKLVSLATALASLAGFEVAPVAANTSNQDGKSPTTDSGQTMGSKATPNVVIGVGEDLLGFVVTRDANGTVVAQGHSSHVSHASHASHASSR